MIFLSVPIPDEKLLIYVTGTPVFRTGKENNLSGKIVGTPAVKLKNKATEKFFRRFFCAFLVPAFSLRYYAPALFSENCFPSFFESMGSRVFRQASFLVFRQATSRVFAEQHASPQFFLSRKKRMCSLLPPCRPVYRKTRKKCGTVPCRTLGFCAPGRPHGTHHLFVKIIQFPYCSRNCSSVIPRTTVALFSSETMFQVLP